jgi:hypothetical protein
MAAAGSEKKNSKNEGKNVNSLEGKPLKTLT